MALKTLLGNDLIELDKVLEDLGKLEGKEETSWMLIETLFYMSKRLKEQERRQQEQELLYRPLASLYYACSATLILCSVMAKGWSLVSSCPLLCSPSLCLLSLCLQSLCLLSLCLRFLFALHCALAIVSSSQNLSWNSTSSGLNRR